MLKLTTLAESIAWVRPPMKMLWIAQGKWTASFESKLLAWRSKKSIIELLWTT